MIDKSFLEARRAELVEQLQEARLQVGALLGALQTVDFFLEELAKGEAGDAQPPPAEVAETE